MADKDGNLLGDVEEIMDRWSKYFTKLLNGSEIELDREDRVLEPTNNHIIISIEFSSIDQWESWAYQ